MSLPGTLCPRRKKHRELEDKGHPACPQSLHPISSCLFRLRARVSDRSQTGAGGPLPPREPAAPFPAQHLGAPGAASLPRGCLGPPEASPPRLWRLWPRSLWPREMSEPCVTAPGGKMSQCADLARSCLPSFLRRPADCVCKAGFSIKSGTLGSGRLWH